MREDFPGAARISVRRSSKIPIKMLRDICYNKAHEIYGENLPPGSLRSVWRRN